MTCLDGSCAHPTPLDAEIARLKPRQREAARLMLREAREGAWGIYTPYNRESMMFNTLRFIDLCLGKENPHPGRDLMGGAR